MLFSDGAKSELIDSPPKNISGPPSDSTIDSNRTKNELEIFLEETPEDDNCVNRKTYNKNESRTGNRHAEILDYIIVRGNDCDPVEIKTGTTVEIYIKVAFHRSFENPVYGFTIKTIDGIKVYGTNTRLDKFDTPPTSAGSIVNFRYEIEMDLAGGDFFITLAIADKPHDEFILADHRTDLIHLHIQQEKAGFNGLIEMKTKSQIIT
jgi:lipopolysaccharide transport system ATP-binding protein